MNMNFITSNPDKFREASLVIPDMAQLDIDLTEIQELDPNQVIAAKLEEAKSEKGRPIIVEDTGLYCNGLNGFPGPLVKWMLKALGAAGLADNVIRTGNTRANAKTILGVLTDSEATHFFEGVVHGQIVMPRGQGFGWDSIFQPDGSDKTFGEMSSFEKQQYSMRAIAFENLKQNLDKLS